MSELGQSAASPESRGKSRSLEAYDDAALLFRARDGDKVAFEALVSRHLERVVATASRILADEQAGRRAACETFVELWSNKDKASNSFDFLVSSILLQRCRARTSQAQGDHGTAPAHPTARLDPLDRQAFALRFGFDLSYGEVSLLLGETEAEVRDRAFRTLSALRTQGAEGGLS